MKKYVLLLLTAITFKANAQYINSLSIFPTSPTISTPIYLIADCSFPSGSCNEHTQGVNISSSSINAWALHCVGMLAFICSHTDTFALGTLNAGTYTASFQLDHGILPSPCTPGFVPGPSSSITFTVGTVTSTSQQNFGSNTLEVYPNPSKDKLYFKQCKKESLKELYNSLGQLIRSTKAMEMDVTLLTSGVYFKV